ncbi:hypothetical protein P879_03112 [Paragonimus westermani]|uniref:Uncharacterized protein n=1 Tax=Paragonimus westermani TaxID=34504 RepID=A0A8T0DIZ9_9TREM|nr:hypothetical protein P879_03112 [Paragonimus westermani]
MPGRTIPDWESGEPLLEVSPVDPSTLERLKREYWRRKYSTGLNPRKRWLLTLFGLTLVLMFIMLAVMFMQLASVAYKMRYFFALMVRLNRNRHNSSTFVA